MNDFDAVLDGDYKIFRAAYEKNYAPLIALLRSEAELTPQHRELLIKILEGRIVRPRHRKHTR